MLWAGASRLASFVLFWSACLWCDVGEGHDGCCQLAESSNVRSHFALPLFAGSPLFAGTPVLAGTPVFAGVCRVAGVCRDAGVCQNFQNFFTHFFLRNIFVKYFLQNFFSKNFFFILGSRGWRCFLGLSPWPRGTVAATTLAPSMSAPEISRTGCIARRVFGTPSVMFSPWCLVRSA